MHLFPIVFVFPFPTPPAPGFTYGAALALAVKSLFSPIFRVDEEG